MLYSIHYSNHKGFKESNMRRKPFDIRDLLEESIFRNISEMRELNSRQIGLAMMIMLGTCKLKHGFYDLCSKNYSRIVYSHDPDRGLYEGKLAGFLSPTRLIDYTNDGRFASEGSYPKMSDYYGSGGSDLFRYDVLSPSYHRDTGSSFSETSRYISREVSSLHKSDANSSKFHPLRTASSRSFESFDSSFMSFKTVHSLNFSEVGSELGHSIEISHDRTAFVPHLPQYSVSGTFDGLDLFSTPFAPQNVTTTPLTSSSSQLTESLLAQSANVVEQSPTSLIPSFSEQRASQILPPSPLDLLTSLSREQSATSNNGKACDVVMPNDGGWATFDMPQNIVPMDTRNSAPAAVPFSDGNVMGKFNPFSIDRSSCQDSASHEPLNAEEKEEKLGFSDYRVKGVNIFLFSRTNVTDGYVENSGMSVGECRNECFKDCSSMTYAAPYLNDESNGCLMLFGNITELIGEVSAWPGISILVLVSKLGNMTGRNRRKGTVKLVFIAPAVDFAMLFFILSIACIFSKMRRTIQAYSKKNEDIELPLFSLGPCLCEGVGLKHVNACLDDIGIVPACKSVGEGVECRSYNGLPFPIGSKFMYLHLTFSFVGANKIVSITESMESTHFLANTVLSLKKGDASNLAVVFGLDSGLACRLTECLQHILMAMVEAYLRANMMFVDSNALQQGIVYSSYVELGLDKFLDTILLVIVVEIGNVSSNVPTEKKRTAVSMFVRPPPKSLPQFQHMSLGNKTLSKREYCCEHTWEFWILIVDRRGGHMDSYLAGQSLIGNLVMLSFYFLISCGPKL